MKKPYTQLRTIDPLVIKGNLDSAWKLLRDYLLAECEYVCQRCKKSNRKLKIHHLDGCALNNQRENLAVVCPHCHGLLHNKLRKKIGILDPFWMVYKHLSNKNK